MKLFEPKRPPERIPPPDCLNCVLKGTVQVHGCGPQPAPLMILGEAPGADEVEQHAPFVGGAGRLLNWLLWNAGITRGACYITNVIKCKPPGNDLSLVPEAPECCKNWLTAEIAATNPNCILALGNTSLQSLTGNRSIMKYRGSILQTFWPYHYRQDGTPRKVVPTIHPAFIMRQQELTPKAVVVADLIRALEESRYPQIKLDPENFILQPSVEQVLAFRQRITDRVSVDIEGADPIVCIGLGADSGHCISVPFLFSGGQYWQTDYELHLIVEFLYDLLADPSITKVFQYHQYDLRYLQEYGFKINGLIEDTLIAHHVAYAGLSHKLHFISSMFTRTPYYKDDVKDEGGEFSFTSDQDLWRYNCRDANVTHTALPEIKKDIAEFGSSSIYTQSCKLIRPLDEMRRNGVLVDPTARSAHSARLRTRAQDLQAEINRLCGYEMNAASNKQVAQLLFQEMGLAPLEYTRTGKPSTEAEVLMKLSKDHEDKPIIQKIVDYREVQHLNSTFVDGLPVGPDNRVHTTFKIHGAVTGRLSSVSPNMQNVAIPIRDMFVATPGCRMLYADYSQLEIRVISYLSRDEPMMAVFESGGDIHKANARDIFGPEAEIDYHRRFFAKAFIYALLYGGSAQTISDFRGHGTKWLDRDEEMIRSAFENFKLKHPQLFAWRELEADKALRDRQIVNCFGRVIPIWANAEAHNRRAAYNYPIQSAAADVINRALIEIYESIHSLSSVTALVALQLQVHDSLMAEVPESVAKGAAELFKHIMEKPFHIGGRDVSFPVEVKIVNRWSEAV